MKWWRSEELKRVVNWQKLREYSNKDGGVLFLGNTAGKLVLVLASSEDGGVLAISNSAGELGVEISSEENGGNLVIYNKTNERVIDLYPDEYGNGRIGAYNRKGKGRVFGSQ